MLPPGQRMVRRPPVLHVGEVPVFDAAGRRIRSLVDAVLRLKQGVGRLLRTTEDRGVVILLDQRLQTQAYGVKFLNSMPRRIQILPDHADIAKEAVEFLGTGRRVRREKS